jgi:hypothetical protein
MEFIPSAHHRAGHTLGVQFGVSERMNVKLQERVEAGLRLGWGTAPMRIQV